MVLLRDDAEYRRVEAWRELWHRDRVTRLASALRRRSLDRNIKRTSFGIKVVANDVRDLSGPCYMQQESWWRFRRNCWSKLWFYGFPPSLRSCHVSRQASYLMGSEWIQHQHIVVIFENSRTAQSGDHVCHSHWYVDGTGNRTSSCVTPRVFGRPPSICSLTDAHLHNAQHLSKTHTGARGIEMMQLSL